MGTLRLTRDGAVLAEIAVNRATAPNTAWPWPEVAEPVMPTGLTVQTGGSYVATPNREFRNCDFGPQITGQRQVFRNCHFGWFGIGYPAADLHFIGCDIGPGVGYHPMITPDAQGRPARRLVFDGCRFHGWHQAAITDHTEGLQIGGVEQMIIRNCTFENNHVFDIMVRTWQYTGNSIRYLLIEDNFLGLVRDISGGPSYYSLGIMGADPVNPTDVLIRRNRHESSISIPPNAAANRVVLGTGLDANIPV